MSKKAPWVLARDEGKPKPKTRRQKIDALYRVLRREYLTRNPRCAVYPKFPSRDIHHTRGRAGTLVIDSRFFMAVCRKAHDEIEMNHQWAVARGYSGGPGEWNTPPDDKESERLRDLIR